MRVACVRVGTLSIFRHGVAIVITIITNRRYISDVQENEKCYKQALVISSVLFLLKHNALSKEIEVFCGVSK